MIRHSADDALVVSVQSFSSRLQLANWLRASGMWREVVPGRADITVQFNTTEMSAALAFSTLRRQLAEADNAHQNAPVKHRLAISLGGENGSDLTAILEQADLSLDDIITAVCNRDFRVEMLGFTPGFAYLSGIDDSYEIARLSTPRARVPAGSIGFITGQLGLYALEGPAGWPIIGRVRSPLFDAHSNTPFLLEAGDVVTLCNDTE